MGPDDKENSAHGKLRAVIEAHPELREAFIGQLGRAARESLDRPDGSPTLPVLDTDFDKALLLDHGHFGVSSPVNPIILATRGIGSSVAVAAYDFNNRLGFLSHSDSLSFMYSEVWSNGAHVMGCSWGNPRLSAHINFLMLDLRSKQGHEFKFDFTIARGPNTPDEMITKLRDSIERRKAPNVQIGSVREILVPDGTFGIDGRSGLLISYDSKLDTVKRESTPHRMLNSFADWAIEGL